MRNEALSLEFSSSFSFLGFITTVSLFYFSLGSLGERNAGYDFPACIIIRCPACYKNPCAMASNFFIEDIFLNSRSVHSNGSASSFQLHHKKIGQETKVAFLMIFFKKCQSNFPNRCFFLIWQFFSKMPMITDYLSSSLVFLQNKLSHRNSAKYVIRKML